VATVARLTVVVAGNGESMLARSELRSDAVAGCDS